MDEILRQMSGPEGERVPQEPEVPHSWDAFSLLLEKFGLSAEELQTARKLAEEAERTLPSWEHRNIILILLAMLGNIPPTVHPRALMQAFSLGMAYQKTMKQ